MPKKSEKQTVNIQKVGYLRHNEYYGMQECFDSLYKDSRDGKVFENLMEPILRSENIMLAYHNIKSNGASPSCPRTATSAAAPKARGPSAMAFCPHPEKNNPRLRMSATPHAEASPFLKLMASPF